MSSKKKWLFLFLFLIFLSQEGGVSKSEVKSESLFLSGSEEKRGYFDISKEGILTSKAPLTFNNFRTFSSFSQSQKREPFYYQVKEGDSVYSLAQNFGISPETILYANNLRQNQKLKEGDSLIILPVDGILYQVKEGDNVEKIAKYFGIEKNEILTFNQIQEDEISIGDIILVPGAKIPSLEETPKGKKGKIKLVNEKGGFQQEQNFASSPLPLSFVCPLPPCNITQGLHWYNAIDFSNHRCGDPVLAVAAGKVIFAKYGWNGGGGNTVKILHQNNIITVYGHLQKISVKEGENVYQGQVIGYNGGLPGSPGAGISTGCHLHFSVIGAKNPFAK
jgi:murein DD-endopeptidase MepM/ murein hydrolase activator NlpD